MATKGKYQAKVRALETQLRAALDTDARALRKFGRTVNQTVVDFDKRDNTDTQSRKMAELLEVLKAELTRKEVESLLTKALENRVDNSRRLLKAQLKARALLS